MYDLNTHHGPKRLIMTALLNISNGADVSLSDPSYPLILTPSQEATVITCLKLLPVFKILVIKGESSSGKYVVASELFQRLRAVKVPFDLCRFAMTLDHEISNQDLTKYFEDLFRELKEKMDIERRKVDSTVTGVIYIRHYNHVADVLTDCSAKARFLLPLVLKNVSESMPEDVRIIITTHGCLLPERLHWCVDLTTTRGDMEHVLHPYCSSGVITKSECEQILKLSKVVPVGRILFCLRYALAITQGNSERETAFIEAYRKALSRFSGSTVDVDKDIPNPVLEDDLIGVEDIIDEIVTSIINPMQLGIPGIPLKKGLLLCGPPGTGKTSIGRWLAHKIKGKFYLIGGEAGVNGPTLVDTFCSMVRRAHDNAPAVIFIDDGDVLFEHDDTYRAFLTILDGIESNKRNDVCVIMTCMDMRRVPASLLRGGRLEMALVTRLPDPHKIEIILERSLAKLSNTLREHKPEAAEAIAKSIARKRFISDLAHKMVGWNCADIHRCVNDVLRLIIADKGLNLSDLFNKCIKQIRDQYELCGRCESTNLDSRPHESYIS